MNHYRKGLDEFNFMHEWILRSYRNILDEINKSTNDIEKAKMSGYLDALSHFSKMLLDAQRRWHEPLIEKEKASRCWIFKYLPEWMK